MNTATDSNAAGIKTTKLPQTMRLCANRYAYNILSSVRVSLSDSHLNDFQIVPINGNRNVPHILPHRIVLLNKNRYVQFSIWHNKYYVRELGMSGRKKWVRSIPAWLFVFIQIHWNSIKTDLTVLLTCAPHSIKYMRHGRDIYQRNWISLHFISPA